ncbi:hypothetical protein Tco_0799736, partial [Tanacetum coccineum]
MAEMINQRKKQFAEGRSKAKRNKPMTQSQLRIYMSNYLKNQGTWKLSQLKKLKFEEIKEEFDKLVQQIDTLVPINLEATKAKLKRYREELQKKTSKKQRFDDKDVPAIGDKVAEVKEEEPVKRTGKRKKQKSRKGVNVDKIAQEDSEIDKEESVEAMNPTPLTTKSDIYMSFGAMVKDFTGEDLIELYRTMFDPPLNEDAIWSLPLQQKMTIMEERRVWVLANHRTTNGHQFTMLNRHKNWLVQSKRLGSTIKPVRWPSPLQAHQVLLTIRAKLEIQGYELALESLESRILRHEKNEMAWEKAVKERDELKDKISKWEESTKNLEEILKEQSEYFFYGRSSDDEHIPENDKFSKNGYKVVPPPITGNLLTPRVDISFAGLDEYAIRNKIIESQTTKVNNKTSETGGKTNYVNTKKPKSVSELVVSNPKINRDSVIIEDWTSDDEEEVSRVQKVRPETRDDKSGQNSHKQGVGFRKVKSCFVCKSTDHLIKDCNFHDKKSQDTARPSVSTARPVCTSRPSISTSRHVSTASPSINTARPIYPRMNNVKPRGSCSPIKRSYYTKPTFRPKDLKQDVKTFGAKNMTTTGKRAVVNTDKGKLNTNLKKSRWVWRPKGNYLDHVSKDSGSFMLKKVEY